MLKGIFARHQDLLMSSITDNNGRMDAESMGLLEHARPIIYAPTLEDIIKESQIEYLPQVFVSHEDNWEDRFDSWIKFTKEEQYEGPRHNAYIDAPDHAEYVKNMIMGVAAHDNIVMVVSAAEGPWPPVSLEKMKAMQDFVAASSEADNQRHSGDYVLEALPYSKNNVEDFVMPKELRRKDRPLWRELHDRGFKPR